jgi:hypothetical protein
LGKKYYTIETELQGLFTTAGDEALNHADRTLRKNYGKKLLEFFYPLPPQKQTFRCFEGLTDIGYSAYCAQWLSYSRHRPFLRFLSSLASFLEFKILKEIDPFKRGNAPYMDPAWKYLCGFDENAAIDIIGEPIENDEPPSISNQYKIDLEEEKINRLRNESDAVMDMLKIETELSDEMPQASDERLPSALLIPAGKAHKTMADFIAGLDEAALNCLELLLQGKGSELETLARAHNAMAELLIDEINAQFLQQEGDLLIEQSLDEGPIIQEEYRDEVLWAITFRNA